MRTQSYPSDVTDAQWVLIEPHLPVYPGGRPRKTDLRDVVDAIFYLVRTGCQWRYLPKDFPPKSTVWRYFDEWRYNGTLDVRARQKALLTGIVRWGLAHDTGRPHVCVYTLPSWSAPRPEAACPLGK